MNIASLCRLHIVTASDGGAPRAVGILTDRDLAIEGFALNDAGAPGWRG